MRTTLATLAILGGLGLAAAGCNGSAGLTAVGSATVDVAGTPSGFNFAQPARLDGAAPAGAITGACTITRTVSAGVTTTASWPTCSSRAESTGKPFGPSA